MPTQTTTGRTRLVKGATDRFPLTLRIALIALVAVTKTLEPTIVPPVVPNTTTVRGEKAPTAAVNRVPRNEPVTDIANPTTPVEDTGSLNSRVSSCVFASKNPPTTVG